MREGLARVLTAVGLGLLAFPAVAGEDGGAKKARRYVVATMGDSLSDPKVHGGKYLRRLAARCPGSTFDTYAKGGQMVNQMRKRFVTDVFGDGKPRYTHVLILGGVNDLISDETAGRTVEKIERDLTAMYDATTSRGAKVIAMTVAPWGGFKKYWSPKRRAATHALNAFIRAQKDEGHLVFDTWKTLGGKDPDYLCEGCAQKDGLHWAAKGHELVADALFEQHFSDCVTQLRAEGPRMDG